MYKMIQIGLLESAPSDLRNPLKTN